MAEVSVARTIANKDVRSMTVSHYKKGEVVVLDDKCGLKMAPDVVHMHVQYGSKIRNLLGYAMKNVKDPNVRQIAWTGSHKAITKVITCVEIMKRKVKEGLHQTTDIRYKRVEEYWEPTLDGLERLKVNKDIPTITILLSKDPPDVATDSDQPPGSFEAFWQRSVAADETGSAKRNSNGDTRRPPASGNRSNPPSMQRKRKKNAQHQKRSKDGAGGGGNGSGGRDKGAGDAGK